MAGTPLRSYIREIEKHIESGRNDEAIAHCRYILESYPKYADTYRLLGKAFLESQRYGDAADIFQRVLSSIPDDFVAHVGMSIIREDEGNLDEAIWHMERAFEIQPANSAIQDELRRLYGRRDGVEPPKIRLTRGALARMYYKGGLYQQAIAETRTALAENTNRLDLQVLLAEIYAKTGQRAEAADTANSILKKIPYCLTANQIMATSLSGTERDQEAQVFRQRLNKLDPYSVFIGPNNPNSASVPDQAISLEKLEWKPGQMTGKSDGQPAWATTIGVELGDLSPSKEESLPEWLSGVSTEKPMATETEGLQPASHALSSDTLGEIPAPGQPAAPPASNFAETIAPGEDLPEWIKAIGEDVPTGEITEQEADLRSAKVEEKTTVGPEEGELAAAEIPDWLRAMAPIPGLKGTPEVEPEFTSWVNEISSPEKAEGAYEQWEAATESVAPQEGEVTPEWITSSETTIEPSGGDEELSKLPDWIAEEPELAQSLTEEVATQEEGVVEGKVTTPEGELPAWLFEKEHFPTEATSAEGLEISPPSVSIETPSEGIELVASDQAVPDWLAESEAASSSVLASEEETLSVEALTPESETPLLTHPSEEKPTWHPEEELTAGTAPQEETELEDTTEEIPDWLKEISVASAVDIPEWLLEEETPSAEIPPVEEDLHGQIERETISPVSGLEEPIPISDTQPTQIVSSEQIFVSPPETIEPAIEETTAEISTQEAAPQEGSEEIFAWLEDMAVNKVDEATTPVQEPGTQVMETEPSVSLTEEEAAFAWLEGLAVKQGADEALLLKPEERLETPPEWIKRTMEDETPAETMIEETPTIEEEAEFAERIPSAVAVEGKEETQLEGPEVEIIEEAPSITVISEKPTPSIEETPLPEISTIMEKGTMPDAALETVSEIESEKTPDTELETLSVAELEAISEPELETTVPPVVVEEITGLEEMPSEAVPETLEIREEESPPPIQKIDLNQISLVELERLPGVGFITAQRIIDFRETNGPFVSINDLLRIPDFNPVVLEEIKDHLFVEIVELTPTSPFEERISITEEGESTVELEQAQKSIVKGNLVQALEEYAKLIQSGQGLSQIIRDLEDISHHYPQEIQVWQKLGDAYLRSDQVQQALNAYVEAERLL